MGILRILLAIAVIIGHSVPFFGLSFTGSAIAVQAFFIISDFYMSLVLNEKYVQHKNYYKLFISNRFLKIFPAYWLVLFLTITVSLVFFFVKRNSLNLDFYVSNHQILNILDWLYLVFTNFFIFLQETTLYFGINIHNGHLFFAENFRHTSPPLYLSLLVPQAWSLSLELVFYLVAPFILLKSKYKYRVWIFLFLSLALNIGLNLSGVNYDPWIRRFFPAQFYLFLSGYISYLIYKKIKLVKQNNILICALLMTITVFYSSVNIFPFKDHIYLLCVVIAIPFIFELTKKSKIDRKIGNLSYIIYILHLLVISVLNILIPNIKYQGYYSFLLIGITILGSLLIDIFILDKIEEVRQKRVKNAC